MKPPGSPRIEWADLPDPVRKGVESLLQARVVEAASQAGGFSPGTADRVLLSDGRRAFVKAVSSSLNPDSPDIHRAEAKIAEQLPECDAFARFFGCFDDGDWVALAFADVEGSQPDLPWQDSDVRAVFAALAESVAAARVAGVSHLPAASEMLAVDMAGWRRLIDAPDSSLPEVATAHLEELATLAAKATEALVGNDLCHGDIRADNVLITRDGAVLVDWPWACSGPAWFDEVMLVINIALNAESGQLQTIYQWESHAPALVAAQAWQISTFLAGISGYFFDSARLPVPAGLPTIRSFQRVQGELVLNWLAHRLNW